MDIGILIGVIGLLIALFTYLFPFDRVSKMFEKKKLDQLAKEMKLRSNYRVAIIDDEIDSFPIDFINKMGFDVKTFESISFADSIEIAKFDVVLLDVKGVVREDLEEGGAKFIKILKEARSALPVVAVSSGKFQPGLNDYFKSSDAILNKPIEEFKIQELLNELKADFFDFEKLSSQLKEQIRKLPVDNKLKSKLEVEVVKYLSSKLPKAETFQLVHQIATIDSEKIIRQIKIMKDRIEND
ncbi:hypothetical protein [Pseudoalteromonas sp.]|uniref:hypothetical protein n=1 Tax=Pseudoalteromonas sp. TaxID=53249 RepID=UPI00272BB31B|nr:hypothetical protein [Pseudoalteromonas sp.]